MFYLLTYLLTYLLNVTPECILHHVKVVPESETLQVKNDQLSWLSRCAETNFHCSSLCHNSEQPL